MKQHTLPLLDLSLADDANGIQQLADQIRCATEQSGFFYVRSDVLSQDTIMSLRGAQRRFFALASQSKAEIAIDQNNRGYLAQGLARMHGASRVDEKEVFFWGPELAADDPLIVAQMPLCGLNQWPADVEGFRQAVLDYSEMIRAIGDKILQAMAVNLGADRSFFAKHYQRAMLRGQLLRYPPTGENAQQFGVAPHTDFGCITLLLTESDGLEVQFPDGSWVAAPPMENTLVINIGDLLERWSNGILPSTRHRVVNRQQVDRYSVAMFYDPDPDAIVDPADLGSDAAEQFEPIAAAEYILSRNRGAFSHYQQEKAPD